MVYLCSVTLKQRDMKTMKTAKTVKVTIEDLRSYVSKKMSRCEFSDKELSECLDLSIRRGNETRGSILKDALNFLYC
jgi:hypothetical protein